MTKLEAMKIYAALDSATLLAIRYESRLFFKGSEPDFSFARRAAREVLAAKAILRREISA